ncbi:MAG: ATP-binding protein [Acetobacteraceae bacterium]
MADASAEYAARVLDGHVLLANRADDLINQLSDEEIRRREAELHAVLRRMIQTRPMALTLYAIDADGVPLVSANVSPLPQAIDLSDRDFFQSLKPPDGTDIYVSRIHSGRLDNELFFCVAMRRGGVTDRTASRDAPPFRGVVLVSLRPEQVAAGFRRLAGETPDVMALIRTDGEILAHSANPRGPPPSLQRDAPIRTVMAAEANRAVFTVVSGNDGVGRLAAVRRVEGWPLYVSAARPRAHIVARWRNAVAWQAGLGIPAAIGLTGLAIFAFRRSREAAEARAALAVEAERRQGAEKLARSDARLRFAADGAGLGNFEADMQKGAIWFDRRAAAILDGNLPPETWVPFGGDRYQTYLAQVHPEDRETYNSCWRKLSTGTSESCTTEFRRRGGTDGWTWIWGHAIVVERDPGSGLAHRVTGFVQDVTERHRMEEERRQGQRLQALGELAGGIAHDFNNVLHAIQGTAELVERGAADPDVVRRRVHRLMKATERGAAITNRLLAFARRTPLRKERVDPAALLRSLREFLNSTLGGTVKLRVEVEPGLPALEADPQQLETALVNLATNARDAMSEKDTLTISASLHVVPPDKVPGAAESLPPGRYVSVAVADTGSGMDAETLARAIEPFFTTKPVGKGTGLGLSMAKGFVEQAGGRFDIDSEPGRGTTVTLIFPAAQERNTLATAQG